MENQFVSWLELTSKYFSIFAQIFSDIVYLPPTYFIFCILFGQIDRDHCTPNPCRNEGICLNTPDDYYCQCSGDSWSWHGKNCTLPRDAVAAAAAAAAAAARAAKTTVAVPTTVSTTTPVTTTTTTTVASTRPPPSPQPRTTTTTPTAAVRRPGTTDPETAVWRTNQHRGDEDDNSKSECRTFSATANVIYAMSE